MGGVVVPGMREKKNPLDDVVRGLQIAQGIYGIKTDMAKLEEHATAVKEAETAKKDVARGLTTPAELAKLGATHNLAEAETPGAVKLFIKTPEGGEKTYFATPRVKAESAKTRAITTRNPDGSEKIEIVPDVVGSSFASSAPREKAPKDITVAERNRLQDQYDRDPEVKKTKQVLDSWNTTQQLLKDPTPASDQALIYAYMKALDPGSVVRESEAETAQALGGLMERAKARFAELAGSGRLSDAQRQDLAAKIQDLAVAASQRQSQIDEQFLGLASRRGVERDDLRFVARPKFDSDEGKAPAAGGGAPVAFKGRRARSPVDGKWYVEAAPDQWVPDGEVGGSPAPGQTNAKFIGNRKSILGQ